MADTIVVQNPDPWSINVLWNDEKILYFAQQLCLPKNLLTLHFLKFLIFQIKAYILFRYFKWGRSYFWILGIHWATAHYPILCYALCHLFLTASKRYGPRCMKVVLVTVFHRIQVLVSASVRTYLHDCWFRIVCDDFAFVNGKRLI